MQEVRAAIGVKDCKELFDMLNPLSREAFPEVPIHPVYCLAGNCSHYRLCNSIEEIEKFFKDVEYIEEAGY